MFQARNVGILVILIGVLMMAYTGFKYTTRESVVDLGPIQVDAKKNHFVTWPPILGGLLIVGGFGMLFLPKNSKTS